MLNNLGKHADGARRRVHPEVINHLGLQRRGGREDEEVCSLFPCPAYKRAIYMNLFLSDTWHDLTVFTTASKQHSRLHVTAKTDLHVL